MELVQKQFMQALKNQLTYALNKLRLSVVVMEENSRPKRTVLQNLLIFHFARSVRRST